MIYFIALIVLIIGVLIYLSTLKGEYQVRQTQIIDADIDTVFNKIKDFKTWPEWSPWLMHEPETLLEYSDNCDQENGFYTWNGSYIGAGKLTHLKIIEHTLITQKLEFTRPFKAVCQVGFEFSLQAGKTEVTWYMNGKMPLFFRFMTEKTRIMISKDYALGLAMLNGLLDNKAKHPEIQFLGKVERAPVSALCKEFSGGIVAMEEEMNKSFPQLVSYVSEQQGQIAGEPFTAYHQSDPFKMQFVCDMAVPVIEGINLGKYLLKTLGGGRYYQISLKGDYKFLELAWYSAIGHIKMLKLKYDKKRPSLEIYENDPQQVEDSNKILTTLFVPIK